LYDIYLKGKKVGEAKIEKNGLYYKFCCVCQFLDKQIYRIYVNDGIAVVKLGVCVQNNDKFELNKKIPVKYISGKKFYFYVEQIGSLNIPVRNDDIFNHLDMLETARLQFTNGQPSIIID
jgi:hypothetical protein